MPVARTFIVRVSADSPGTASGTVESVRTGEKQRFRGMDGIGQVIASMFSSTPPEEQRPLGGQR